MTAFLQWLFIVAAILLGVIILLCALIGVATLVVAGKEPHYDEWPGGDMDRDLAAALLTPDDPQLPEEGTP